MGKMVFGYYGFFVTRIIRHTYESLKYENIEVVDTNGALIFIFILYNKGIKTLFKLSQGRQWNSFTQN